MVASQLNELSLFTGAGGGVWASKILDHKIIGYVEKDEYCQQVIRARIDDGSFDNAPIFNDVREFVESGAARQYRGFADVVSAGFPCQPFSTSGKQKGESDDRNAWPETIEILRKVRPAYAFLENVPGLLVDEYFRTILADLAQVFPNIRGACIGNQHCGTGVCNSERLWIVASSANCSMLEGLDFHKFKFAGSEESFRRQHSGAVSAMLQQDDYTGIKRNSNAMARGKHRLKAIGNGQIPALAVAAWQALT